MSIRSGFGAARRKVLSSLYRRGVPLGDFGPIVSFTFDDFPRTAYTTGGAILEQFGGRGTYYAAAGLMNTTNELGEQFRSEDIDSLLEKGHELASHTFSHISCRSVSEADFRAEVIKGGKAIKELAGLESPNFAYPYGHVTLQTKRSLELYVSSARSILPGFNEPEVDLNLLRANSLYGDLEVFKRAEELVLENTKRKSWLIFYTHDVRTNPSPYGCTAALFESVVSFAARSGSRILTVQEVLSEVGAQNACTKGQAQCAGLR